MKLTNFTTSFVIQAAGYDSERMSGYIRKMLLESDGAPDDIVTEAEIGPVKVFWIPMAFYWGNWTATWHAEVGIDRTENYHDDQGHARTRTVTDWYPRNGSDSGSYSLTRSKCESIEITGLRWGMARTIIQKMVAAVPQDAMEVTCDLASQIYSDLGPSQIPEASIDVSGDIHDIIKSQVKGKLPSKVRNLQIDPKTWRNSKHTALPVAHVEWTYKNKCYQYYRDVGTHAETVMADSAPLDVGKSLNRISSWIPALLPITVTFMVLAGGGGGAGAIGSIIACAAGIYFALQRNKVLDARSRAAKIKSMQTEAEQTEAQADDEAQRSAYYTKEKQDPATKWGPWLLRKLSVLIMFFALAVISFVPACSGIHSDSRGPRALVSAPTTAAHAEVSAPAEAPVVIQAQAEPVVLLSAPPSLPEAAPIAQVEQQQPTLQLPAAQSEAEVAPLPVPADLPGGDTGVEPWPLIEPTKVR